jgi:uncharacterized protein
MQAKESVMQPYPIKKLIHLLYVPTIFCNMGCEYCYLGDLTESRSDNTQAIETLAFSLEKLLSAGYLPFNLSFHGGEVTTLPSQTLRQLLLIAQRHYQTYGELIKQQGFKLNPVHIKTNLLNFPKHYALLDEFVVSISASIDLPLNLHERYRVDKKGQSTLSRMQANLRLLAQYPRRKKLSCVVTKAHLNQIEQFIADIWYLHREVGLDMNRFNIMFSFDSQQNARKFQHRTDDLLMLSSSEQVTFYKALQQAFSGTVLESGFKNEWFCEFTPDYCCSAVNCGDKFFLLQYDGSVYSCPRGQSSTQYYYGNVFQQPIEDIVNNGWQVIERNENKTTLADDCLNCEYIQYCHSGCTFVRTETGTSKSYTCELQKVLYQADPERYPPLSKSQIPTYTKTILLHNHLHKIMHKTPQRQTFFTPELVAPENSLQALIAKDENLQAIYAKPLFYIEVDQVRYDLQSPTLSNEHPLAFLNQQSQVILGVRQDSFEWASDEPVNNTVLLMLLRNTTVTYGDEARHKQEHLMDYALYSPSLIAQANKQQNYYHYDISAILRLHSPLFLAKVKNNLCISTKALREYHYAKQRRNAFYHIQAINLPFPNFEFFWQEV